MILDLISMKMKMPVLVPVLMIFSISIPHAEGAKNAETAGQQKSQPAMEESRSDQSMNVNISLHDLELVTQDGLRVKFKSDVIADKLVAMTFIYTTCTTICPIYNAIFSQLQPLLGERLGREVIMVSITLDPTTDVPRRLKREAERFKAKPGWIYLTGEKQNVDQVLKGLDAYFPDFQEHPPMAIVGDGRTGTWKRFNGFPRPEELLALIDELKAARGENP